MRDLFIAKVRRRVRAKAEELLERSCRAAVVAVEVRMERYFAWKGSRDEP